MELGLTVVYWRRRLWKLRTDDSELHDSHSSNEDFRVLPVYAELAGFLFQTLHKCVQSLLASKPPATHK